MIPLDAEFYIKLKLLRLGGFIEGLIGRKD
jgi:hypothetical protein